MSQPIQILHVVGRVDGYGTSGQLRLLARQQLADGHSVSIAALTADRLAHAACEGDGLRPLVLDRRWKCDPIAALRLARTLRSTLFDVAHMWDREAVQYFAIARRRSRHATTLATLSDLPRVIGQSASIDRLVVTSETAREAWERLAISPEKVKVIPPGVPRPTPPTQTREQLLNDISLPQDSKLIAVSGRLVRASRVDEAIWFFELVRTLDERARLLVFGDGPDRRRLERFARLTSEPAAVRFMGYRADVTALLPHVDVLWSLGLRAESHAPPQQLLEAMATRVPVVAADVPACREIIVPGRSGCLAPPADRAGFARQTLRLLDDKRFANEMTARAEADIASNYSTEGMTRSYALLYGELIGRPAGVD